MDMHHDAYRDEKEGVQKPRNHLNEKELGD